MLPGLWHTERLRVQDVGAADLELCGACLAECEDVAALDPAFKPVPPSEIEAHIQRSLQGAESEERAFQMQTLRLASTGEAVGYWHFMVVPAKPAAVGVSILLVRPAHRRQGLGQELVAGALARFHPAKREIWARVFLANPAALEFWARQGFRELVLHQATYVWPPRDTPSVILGRRLTESADA